jgi:hypothetical protein
MNPRRRVAEQFTATITGPVKGARRTCYQGSFHAARAWLINAIIRQAAYWVGQEREGNANAASAVAVLVEGAMLIARADGEVEVAGGALYLFVLRALPVRTAAQAAPDEE